MSCANDLHVLSAALPIAKCHLLQTTEVADAAYFMWYLMQFPSVRISNLTFDVQGVDLYGLSVCSMSGECSLHLVRFRWDACAE